MGHVDQNYTGVENYRAANRHPDRAPGRDPLAQALGGGMVVGIDGMRFVWPRPPRGPGREWLPGRRGRLWLFGGDAAVCRVDHGGAVLAIALVAADLSGGFLVPLADGLGDRFGAELVIA